MWETENRVNVDVGLFMLLLFIYLLLYLLSLITFVLSRWLELLASHKSIFHSFNKHGTSRVVLKEYLSDPHPLSRRW